MPFCVGTIFKICRNLLRIFTNGFAKKQQKAITIIGECSSGILRTVLLLGVGSGCFFILFLPTRIDTEPDDHLNGWGVLFHFYPAKPFALCAINAYY